MFDWLRRFIAGECHEKLKMNARKFECALGIKEIHGSFMKMRGENKWHIFAGIERTIKMSMYCDIGLYHDEVEEVHKLPVKDICPECLKKRHKMEAR